MEEKFSRTLEPGDSKFPFQGKFEVEKYLKGKGDDFVKRFDANSYLYLSKAMDHFDVSGPKLIHVEKSSHLKFLVIAFKSDWLYPLEQSRRLSGSSRFRRVHASYLRDRCPLWATILFLFEVDEQAQFGKTFLKESLSGAELTDER